jgi:PAS domain S-box-containing protein
MLNGRSLTLRQAIVLTVVLGLLVPVLLFSGYSWLRQYTDGIRRQTQEMLQQNADILSNGMQEPLWNINQESGNALVEAMMLRNEDIVQIEVRDNALGLFVAAQRPKPEGGFVAVTEQPVVYRGTTIGSVKVRVSSARLREAVTRDLLGSMSGVLAQAALSIALILILLERRLVRPLQKLGSGAERLASRELEVPFTWQRLDEIGMLGRRLEDTRVSLRRLFAELDHKNQELERDIDKRKRIEQELHEREERYRALVEQSPIAIIEWDSSFRVAEWNDAAEKIFGYPREYVMGRHASFIVADGRQDAVDSRFRRMLEEGGDTRHVAANRRADRRIIACQWSHARITGDAGRPDRLLSIAEDITEKRRAEEALSLSEAKFATAFQSNPDSVSLSRMADGVLIDVNQTFERLTGYGRDEIVGRTALDLQLWVEIPGRRTMLQQLASHRMVRNHEWKMRTKDGRLRQCMTNASMFQVGGETYVLAVIRDITDQRLLEEQKAEADRALLRLAQGTRDIAGEAFFELLVADLAAALRTDCAFIGLRAPSSQASIVTIATHLRGATVQNFTYATHGTPCQQTLDGELSVFPAGARHLFPADAPLAGPEWASYAGAPLRDAAGNAIGVLVVMHTAPLGNPDLVRSLLQVFSERASAELERKRAEEELRNSEQRFSAIFQSSPVAMFVCQLNGDYLIRDVNHAFERLFQHGRAGVIGKSTVELKLYRDLADRQQLIHELEHGGVTEKHREVWMRRGDGSEVLVQFAGHTFTLAGERFGILACADVTDKRRIENEILELNAHLEQRVVARTEELQQANRELATTLETLHVAQEELVRNEKLAALGSLVAGIAHELNTPIGNSLMVASTLADQTRTLARDYRGDTLKRSSLEGFIDNAGTAGEILMRNLQRAADLVTGFKQVAVDQTTSQRRKFSVAEVVSEIILTLWPTLKKTSIVVRQEIPSDLRMDSYPGPLGQVITNLVNNALLHAFEGRTAGIVTIAATAEHGWVELTVRDDGAGIPASDLNRIFDPFFTTKLGAGGSGLGLHITHNIVTGVLGGRIRVQSEIGRGAAFVLSLPLLAPLRQSEDEAQRTPA